MAHHSELQFLIEQIKDAWQGDPWFGQPAIKLLQDISEEEAYARPTGQHSIADLIWHMVNWRHFTLNRIDTNNTTDLQQFEEADWRQASPDGPYDLSKGLAQLQQTQQELEKMLLQQTNAMLERHVAGRVYTFRKLLHGLLQHDIYHLGQIVYLRKLLAAGEKS